MTTYLCLDTETNSLDPSKGQVIEVGWCLVTKELLGPSGARFVAATEVGRTDLHHITLEMLEGAGTLEEALEPIRGLKFDVVLAQNAPFDHAFLHGTWIWDLPWQDALETWRKSTMKSCALGRVAAAYGVDAPVAHRAEADAITLARCWQRYLQSGFPSEVSQAAKPKVAPKTRVTKVRKSRCRKGMGA
jgi:DNA polymerase III alpha subunit (gram-positive type)